MLRNYLKASLRYLSRRKFYTLANLFGLSLGIATFLLISLYVLDELSFDQFHSKADRISRLWMSQVVDEENPKAEGNWTWASVPRPLGENLKKDFEEVEAIVRITNNPTPLIAYGENKFYGGTMLFVDTTFFSVFNFQLLKGDPAKALADPYSVLVTPDFARKIFGDEDPVGKIITYNSDEQLVITGIVEPAPSTSTIQYELISPFSFEERSPAPEDRKWNYSCQTFVLLRDKRDIDKLNAGFNDYFRSVHPGHNGRLFAGLTPLSDIHLREKIESDFMKTGGFQATIEYVYLLGGIAILVLVIACINYINLTTANAIRRGKDVGLRKTIGAAKNHILVQYLSESVILVVISFAISIAAVTLILPAFNSFTERQISVPVTEPWFIAFSLTTIAVVSFLAGFYPSFHISRLQPKLALDSGTSGRKDYLLRYGLIGFQYFISFFLLIATFVFKGQMDYLQESNLGFNRENVVVLEVGGKLKNDFSSLRNALLEHPDIKSVASASGIPSEGIWISASKEIEGLESSGGWAPILFQGYNIDPWFMETMEMELVEGRHFHDSKDDEETAVLVSETFARNAGWESQGNYESAVGKYIKLYDDKLLYVVGVVKDFHYRSLKETIEPVVLTFRASETKPSSYINGINYVVIRINDDNPRQSLGSIQNVWEANIPDYPFEYSFLDEDFDNMYRREEKLSSLVEVFTILAIAISLIGVLGMAMFTVERRMKEISIRKVLGATVTNIITMLSKDYVKLLAIAFVIAIPPVIYFINKGLEEFVYKIDIAWWYYAIPGLIVLVLTVLVVGLQSLGAALTNPAETLRSE